MTVGPHIPEIQFDLENSRSKVKVKGILVSVASSWLISFSFTSIGPTIPKIWQIECWTGEKRIWNFTKKIAKIFFDRIPPKFNQVECVTRGIYLSIFVAIGWAVFTLSWRQGKLGPASVAYPRSPSWVPKNFPTLLGQPCVVWRN